MEISFASKPEKEYLESAIEKVMQIHLHEEVERDILLFLTSQEVHNLNYLRFVVYLSYVAIGS